MFYLCIRRFARLATLCFLGLVLGGILLLPMPIAAQDDGCQVFHYDTTIPDGWIFLWEETVSPCPHPCAPGLITVSEESPAGTFIMYSCRDPFSGFPPDKPGVNAGPYCQTSSDRAVSLIPAGGDSHEIQISVGGVPGTVVSGTSHMFTSLADGVAHAFRGQSHGEHGASGWSDWAGPVYQDLQAPVTTFDPAGIVGSMGWWLSEVTVALPATDAGCAGVSQTFVTLDGASGIYGGPFLVTGDGMHGLAFFSTDGGNLEAPQTETINIDTLPPSITLTPGRGFDAPSGWWHSAVAVSIEIEDATSGVASQVVSLDSGGWVPYDNISLTFEGDGVHTLDVEVSDMAGNASADGLVIRIDGTPPQTVLNINGTLGANGWYVDPSITVSLAASDATSGVFQTLFELDGASRIYERPFSLHGEWMRLFSFGSVDNAGNVEQVQTQYIGIDATPPELTGYYCNSGQIFTHGEDEFQLSAQLHDNASGIDQVRMFGMGENGAQLDFGAMSPGGSPRETDVTLRVHSSQAPPGHYSLGLEFNDIAGHTVRVEGLCQLEVVGAHEVLGGQTLASIAEQHGLPLWWLIEANPQIDDPNVLVPGQWVNLPAGPPPENGAPRALFGAPLEKAEVAEASIDIPMNEEQALIFSMQSSPIVGDTLWTLYDGAPPAYHIASPGDEAPVVMVSNTISEHAEDKEIASLYVPVSSSIFVVNEGEKDKEDDAFLPLIFVASPPTGGDVGGSAPGNMPPRSDSSAPANIQRAVPAESASRASVPVGGGLASALALAATTIGTGAALVATTRSRSRRDVLESKRRQQKVALAAARQQQMMQAAQNMQSNMQQRARAQSEVQVASAPSDTKVWYLEQLKKRREWEAARAPWHWAWVARQSVQAEALADAFDRLLGEHSGLSNEQRAQLMQYQARARTEPLEVDVEAAMAFAEGLPSMVVPVPSVRKSGGLLGGLVRGAANLLSNVANNVIRNVAGNVVSKVRDVVSSGMERVKRLFGGGGNPSGLLVPGDVQQEDEGPQAECPQDGVYDEEAEMCEFEYIRQNAVDYAIAFSQEAIPNFFFTHGTYPGGTMPDGWYTIGSDGERVAKPWVGTDCANFVSQVLFFGQLPLTQYWDVTTYEMEGYEDYRLRVDGSAWGSALWAGLRTYLEYADDVSNNQYIEIYSDLFRRGNTDGRLSIGHPASINEAVNISEEMLQDIRGGDVMYWQTGQNEAHLAIVVGWGQPVANWDALDISDQPLPIEYREGCVPYVVDHGPQGEIFPAYAVPRPYYALWWTIPDEVGNLLEQGRLGFVYVPDTLTFDPSELRLLDEDDIEWEDSFRQYSEREIDEGEE